LQEVQMVPLNPAGYAVYVPPKPESDEEKVEKKKKKSNSDCYKKDCDEKGINTCRAILGCCMPTDYGCGKKMCAQHTSKNCIGPTKKRANVGTGRH